MYYVGVVTEAHNSAILEIGCEEVSWPEVSIFHPGLLSMTPQAVNEDNTRFRDDQQSVATSLWVGRTRLRACRWNATLTGHTLTSSGNAILSRIMEEYRLSGKPH